MSVRVLHSADIHYCREYREEALASLAVLRDTARERRVDLVVIAGDLFERGIQASDRDGMPELLAIMREILDIGPVVCVYGTVTHDVPGCYEVLTHLSADHNFMLLYPDTAYVLTAYGAVAPYVDQGEHDDHKLLILGCPEPGKGWLLANNNGLGSAEATQAVNDSMRALLLGLGGMRREHADLPCLMVYHGAVRGATMGSGQLVGSSEIAVGREDLAMVGADYYALGHIHQGQQIGEHPMHYAGSAYPTDWGELDQKGCLLITLETPSGGERWITGLAERIPFPHPARVKIEARAERVSGDDAYHVDLLPDALLDAGLGGRDVWLALSAEAIIADDIDVGVWLKRLRDSGAGSGSRVTIEKIAVETVRAAEITEAQHLREKVVVQAEASSLPAPAESVLAKAGALESEAKASGKVGEGLHIQVHRLTLRGAIGIHAGLGVDEVTLDLDDYQHGLIALVGPNGIGKSTLIENLHPYGRLLTRSGSLQSHFRLKDSRRELIFSDERTGKLYRSTILIDPTLATPKAEYHLAERDPDLGWRPLTNDRREDYDAKIAELWGSIEMFARSAFVAQKPPRGLPDLADATAGERKALFRELGGLDYLQAYAEAAKGKADAMETDIEIERGKAGVIRPLLEQEPERRTALELTERGLEHARESEASILEEGKAQRKTVDGLAKQAQEQAEIVRHRSALRDEGERLLTETAEEGAKIERAQDAVAGRHAATETVNRAAVLEKARRGLEDAQTQILSERDRLGTEHARALAAHRKARDEVQAEIRRLEKCAAELETKKAGVLGKIDALTAEVERPLDETCPTCGQRLPATTRAGLIVIREQKRAALSEQQEAVLGFDNQLMDNERERKAQERRLSEMIEPKQPDMPTWTQQPALDTVIEELGTLDVDAARETIRAADAAREQLKAAVARQTTIATRVKEIDRERAELLAKVDETVATQHAEARAKLDNLHQLYAEATAKTARLDAETKGLREILADLEHKRATLAEIEGGIAKASAEAREWRYLERACGRDGIQALELDAMGPSIAETANRLLDAAYGSRFRIEIRTTRIAGRGSKTKQVEDFEIIVRDTERGTEQPLDTLSGGETVWVRKALYAAFGTIRAKSRGTRFLTVSMDEADGALDPDARRRYIAMLEAEHAEACRAHTIVITHSEAAQEMIAQRIDMRELAAANGGKEVAA